LHKIIIGDKMISPKKLEPLTKELKTLNDNGRTRLTIDEFYTLARRNGIIEKFYIKEVMKYYIAVGLLTHDGMILIFTRDTDASEMSNV
jgi:hypothetical protein